MTLFSQAVYALIRKNFTILYITPLIASKIDIKYAFLQQLVELSTMIGEFILPSHVYQGCTVLVNDRPTSYDSIEMIILDIDNIIVMY